MRWTAAARVTVGDWTVARGTTTRVRSPADGEPSTAISAVPAIATPPGSGGQPGRELERTGAGVKVLEAEWVQGEGELDSGRAEGGECRLHRDQDPPIGQGGVGLHAGLIQGDLPVAAADRDRVGGSGEPGPAARLEIGGRVDPLQDHPGGKLLRCAGEGGERGQVQARPGDADLAGNRASEVAEVGVEREGGGVAPGPQA